MAPAPAHVAPPVPEGLDPAVHARRWWTLAVLCLSLVVIGVDNTILNVALPTLVEDLGATTSQLQWIVDGYVLVFAGLLLTAGSLGDRFGRRRALTGGLLVFGAASVLASMAATPGQLIAARGLMGIGAAFIMPSTLSIVTNTFLDPTERARAIGVWAGFSALGIAIGPLAGGWLLEHYFWGSVFLVNLPIVALALVGGRLVVPESRDPAAPRLDPAGAVLSMVGLAALLWAIIEAPVKGWTSAPVLAAAGVAAVALGAFVWWERRSDHPMLDLGLFRNPRFSAASAAVTLTFFALFGSLFLLTQHLQFVLGYSALGSGARVVPFAATLMVVAPLSSRVVERVGTKAVVATGLAVVAAGLALLVRTSVDAGYGPVVLAQVVMAAGMGLTMAPATESIMGALPRDRAGVGSAVNDTTRQVGGALGVAVIGSAFASVYGGRMADAVAGVGLPGDAATAAGDSVGAALAVADRIGGPSGEALAEVARQSFVDGLHVAVLIGAGVALLGALVALAWLPARAPDAVPSPASAPAHGRGAVPAAPDPVGPLVPQVAPAGGGLAPANAAVPPAHVSSAGGGLAPAAGAGEA